MSTGVRVRVQACSGESMRRYKMEIGVHETIEAADCAP